MTFTNRIRHVLSPLRNPSKAELKEALLQLHITIDELQRLPQPSKGKPYNRKLLYKNNELELLVMNWSDIECATHDHGSSHGWIQVLSGTSKNTVYELTESGLPVELFQKSYYQGKCFFAPKKGIHKMQAAKDDMITLHLYSPPIKGMKVYDLEKCAACVVSDDCGAWWPKEQYQKVKEIQFNQKT